MPAPSLPGWKGLNLVVIRCGRLNVSALLIATGSSEIVRFDAALSVATLDMNHCTDLAED